MIQPVDRIEITVPSDVPAYIKATSKLFSSKTTHFPTQTLTIGRLAALIKPMKKRVVKSRAVLAATKGTASVSKEFANMQTSKTHFVLKLNRKTIIFLQEISDFFVSMKNVSYRSAKYPQINMPII